MLTIYVFRILNFFDIVASAAVASTTTTATAASNDNDDDDYAIAIAVRLFHAFVAVFRC